MVFLMAVHIYDDHGIRFEYPVLWEVEETADGDRASVTAQATEGLAYVLITTDTSRPAPAEMVAEAMRAMREEYPDVEVTPEVEPIDGHRAEGFDLEFFNLDLLNGCMIRAYRSAKRTILVFSQWADLEGEDAVEMIRGVMQSLEETDT